MSKVQQWQWQCNGLEGKLSGIPPFNIIILNGGIPLALDYITTI